MQGERGFTLIELMVVVMVAVILAMIATPSFRSFIAGQRIKAASINIVNTLSLARSEAVTRNAVVTTSPAGGDWKAGWTVTAADGTVVNKQNTGLPGLSVQCVSSGTAVICPIAGIVFNGSGRLTAPVPSIQLTDSSTPVVRCVAIGLNGRSMSTASPC